MSIEEKAKAYDEALAIAKQVINNNCSEVEKLCLECVLPELKESEDERIRKTLLRYCDDWEKGQFGCMKKEDVPLIRAYLEKQKEQKPAQYDLDVLEKHITKDSISELAHTVMIRNGWDIVEKEQKPEEKPINWTELTWEDINELEEIINKVHYEFRAGIGQESFGKEVLEQFREYKGDEYLDEIEQKPAEWSEKDKKLCQKTIEWLEEKCFPYALDDNNPARDCIVWLKSLPERFNLQPKQEWSEEDEKIRQSIIEDLEFERNYTSATIAKADNLIRKYNEQIAWLNSHHFDYRGLIEKGLALEAPEEMYRL